MEGRIIEVLLYSLANYYVQLHMYILCNSKHNDFSPARQLIDLDPHYKCYEFRYNYIQTSVITG